MKSFYSIIRFVNNPLSKENLAIGMIVISEGKVFYKFSKDKINLVNKINSSSSSLLEYTIDKVSSFIDIQLKEEVSLFSREISVNLEYLNRLSIYNNGFLQFDKPSVINMAFDTSKFHNFFGKYIELNLREPKKAIIDRTFKRTIEDVFRKPLLNVIDINYKVKKEQIPGLFFDYTLDGIGVNGSVYTVKSIDLNSEKPIDNFRRDISELESLNYRMDLFSKENNLDSDKNNHYLVIDPYTGSKSSYHQLYNILMEQNDEDYPYSVINTNVLPQVTKEIMDSQSIIKFSEYLETL
ncbi:hypothetical protein [Gelidibacter pelagius]|uniref:DUF3037 family protein n=1 Tax=Gelidibacter pelagius TaxID=2819985 RepID=A0ABS3SQ94_9FLAO|nr:hypothetical protein [Gelidibacter pelagius]MBO3097834.1 hypothetical protein [Gelidibacter pelagius]